MVYSTRLCISQGDNEKHAHIFSFTLFVTASSFYNISLFKVSVFGLLTKKFVRKAKGLSRVMRIKQIRAGKEYVTSTDREVCILSVQQWLKAFISGNIVANAARAETYLDFSVWGGFFVHSNMHTFVLVFYKWKLFMSYTLSLDTKKPVDLMADCGYRLWYSQFYTCFFAQSIFQSKD